MSLLKRIAELREINGNISVNRLEKETGLTRGSMAKWDDHSPSTEKLKKVADYFGVTMDFFYGEEKTPTDGERTITDDDIKFALFGGDGEITDAMYQEVRNFADYIKQREADKKKE